MSSYVADTDQSWIVLPDAPLQEAERTAWLKEVEQELPYPDPDVASTYMSFLREVVSARQDEDVTKRLFFLPSSQMAPVMLELFEYAQDKDLDEATALAGLITVDKNERGPHVSEAVELVDGRVVYRSVAAIPIPDTEDEADVAVCAFHAVRVGDVDVVTRTWVGESVTLLAEVIVAVEALLGSLRVVP
ncbi:hypothetical protein [Actinomyces trachealis]|uniref:hypothetical protein n=1 Tax=Actinomyces trachealis TaxID=2763540 RepID=UPI001892B248|nr:hypothetical protein [Actinomyces trachealis]